MQITIVVYGNIAWVRYNQKNVAVDARNFATIRAWKEAIKDEIGLALASLTGEDRG